MQYSQKSREIIGVVELWILLSVVAVTQLSALDFPERQFYILAFLSIYLWAFFADTFHPLLACK